MCCGGCLIIFDDDEWLVLVFVVFSGVGVWVRLCGYLLLVLWVLGFVCLDEVVLCVVVVVGIWVVMVYGEYVVVDLVVGLVECDVVVVFGGVYGIDGVVYCVVLDFEGIIVVVLVGGFDILYLVGYLVLLYCIV